MSVLALFSRSKVLDGAHSKPTPLANLNISNIILGQVNIAVLLVDDLKLAFKMLVLVILINQYCLLTHRSRFQHVFLRAVGVHFLLAF